MSKVEQSWMPRQSAKTRTIYKQIGEMETHQALRIGMDYDCALVWAGNNTVCVYEPEPVIKWEHQSRDTGRVWYRSKFETLPQKPAPKIPRPHITVKPYMLIPEEPQLPSQRMSPVAFHIFMTRRMTKNRILRMNNMWNRVHTRICPSVIA